MFGNQTTVNNFYKQNFDSRTEMAVDAHFHLWDVQMLDLRWPTPDMPEIYKSFGPQDFKATISTCGTGKSDCLKVVKGIVVQVRQSYAETDWMLQLAEENDEICGVIGWVDLKDPKLEEHLKRYIKNPYFVGVRHIVEAEEDDWLGDDHVQKGFEILEQMEVPFDLLIWPRHYKIALEIVKKFPKLQFIIDHCGKPRINIKSEFEMWQSGLEKLAHCQNVYCKISGLARQTENIEWESEDVDPYIKATVNVFGTKRCMFGSDWPVCNMHTTYERWVKTVEQSLSRFSEDEQSDVFTRNANRIYNIKV